MRYLYYTIIIILVFSCTRKNNVIITSSQPETHKDSISEHSIPNNLPSSQTYIKTPSYYYSQGFEEIKDMLEGRRKPSFKRAVFATENAFYSNGLNYDAYYEEVKTLSELCKAWCEANRNNLQYEHVDDFEKVLLNCSIYKLLTDTIWLSSNTPLHYPYTYDFEDFFGNNDWSKMFVTKLMVNNSGNCHSLPYLYKILADELNTNASLAFAPNHIYIKHKNKKIGMYNTELTSGQFPLDAWLMCSGYISTEAIINEIYMDTLSNKEAIAYTLVDLAQGYEKKFGKQDGKFILECTDLALKHFPNSINALLLKAETEKHIVNLAMKRNGMTHPSQIQSIADVSELFSKMESTYSKIVLLGYREMPPAMYSEWLLSAKNERYRNRKVNNIFTK